METLRISKKDLETFGSSTLIGMLSEKFGQYPKELRIEFEQTSMDWKRQHNGPDEILLTEHVPMCLATDIVHLMEQGIKIEIGEYT